MYAFEQQIPVQIQFRGMEKPFAISVPMTVLRYLDTSSLRSFAPSGDVVYHQMSLYAGLPCREYSRDLVTA